MLRIHGDGTLLRSLLLNEQGTNAFTPEERSHKALAIENDLHYHEPSYCCNQFSIALALDDFCLPVSAG